MNKSKIITLQLVLLTVGTIGWVWQSTSFHEDGKLAHEPNLLHLKRSPFGRTLALAMRGPVDVYWHRGGVHDHGEGHDHENTCAHGCTHEHGPECADGCEHEGHEKLGHGHEHDHDNKPAGAVLAAKLQDLGEHAHDHGAQDLAAQEAAPPAPAEFKGVRSWMLDRIDGMRKSYYSRTNNRADSKFHKAYIMGETQKRLAVSYEMDPSNLSGYGAYFLFLSEALARIEGKKGEDGIITVSRKAAHTLAHSTLGYCLELKDEAPAMITAATAAHDCLQIVLEGPDPDLKLASEYLRLLDGTLQQYESLRRKMMEEGTWELFPVNRRSEMEKSHSLVRALRNVDHELFGKLTATSEPSVEPPSS